MSNHSSTVPFRHETNNENEKGLRMRVRTVNISIIYTHTLLTGDPLESLLKLGPCINVSQRESTSSKETLSWSVHTQYPI